MPSSASAATSLVCARPWTTSTDAPRRPTTRVKAFGAGLLSSIGEIEQFATAAELLPFDIDRMATTDYDPTVYQPTIFLAPSWEGMYFELASWLDDGGWRSSDA